MKITSEHTFVICAYKESEYLEETIQSLKQQTMPTNVVMVTSTPNSYINGMSEKYNVPLIINSGEAGIAGDWNFGYHQVKTEVVTICHQDDIYSKYYVEKIMKAIEKDDKTLIAFSGYGELRGREKVFSNCLLTIKKILLLPLRIPALQKSVWVRRRVLSFGCSICCPSVTYVKKNLPETIFQSNFKSNLDWEAWEMLSKRKGRFRYIPEPLVLHRIHEESETSKIIGDSLRTEEDYEMFCKFWPRWIAKRISKIYQTSEQSNNVK